MKWFNECETVEQIKKAYRDLMMKHHPDHGGDTETAKEINAELNQALQIAMIGHFDDWKKANPKSKYDGFKAGWFADILEKIIQWNMTIEIIGFWIYAFDSFEYKDQLKEMGFWFSKKHKAWIFNGSGKIKIRTGLSIKDVRMMHGGQHVRSKKKNEDKKMIA